MSNEAVGIKRLLLMAVFKNKLDPKQPKKIQYALGKVHEGRKLNEAFDTSLDNINSYLRETKATKSTHLLPAINIALYRNENVVTFETPLSGVPEWSDWCAVVEGYIQSTSITQKSKNVLIAPDYKGINPTDIQAHKRGSSDNVLKSHLLYHSPVAVEIWERIKVSPKYPLYGLCENGLVDVLNSNEWKGRASGITQIFNLGAGSASKDKCILDALKQISSDCRFVWVDASWAMLQKTIGVIDRRDYPNFDFLGVAADFERPLELRRVYDNSVSSPPRFDERKAFFILGFTLSNLNETNFFSEYAQVCTDGDLMVFPMQFIPETLSHDDNDAMANYENSLKKCYDFPDGHKLSKAGLANLPDHVLVTQNRPDCFPYILDKSARSRCVQFSIVVKNTTTDEDQILITARSSRHYKKDYIDYLEKMGFHVVYISPEHFSNRPEDRDIPAVRSLLVEYRKPS